MMKRVMAAVAGLLLAGAGMGLFAAPASAVKLCTDDGGSSCAQEYGNWGGVESQDVVCDGDPVYANYQRDTGSSQTLWNYSGCGHSEFTGTSSNLINHFRSCTDDWFGDTCTSYAYR